MRRSELEGKRFGRLLVLGTVPRRNKCDAAIWLCQCDCGKETRATSSALTRGDTRSCGCLHREVASRKGPNHPHWRGGRHPGGAGYTVVWVPDHPRAQQSIKKKGRGFVLEHVIVMEKMIGRYLLPGENVHHKNGCRSDNRPENLELWCVTQPKGQRVEDLIVWAKELLQRYEPEALVEQREKQTA